MANPDELNLLNYDPQRDPYHFLQRTSWPVSSGDMMPSHANLGMSYQQRSAIPTTQPNAIQSNGQPFYQTDNHQQQQQNSTELRSWSTPHGLPMSSTPYIDTNHYTQEYETYSTPFDLSPTDYQISANMPLNAGLNNGMDATLPLEAYNYMPMANPMANSMSYDWPENIHGLMEMNLQGLAGTGPPHPEMVAATSPSDTFDVRSLPSSSSDNGFVTIDYPTQQPFIQDYVFHHPRSGSDSSSDHEHCHQDSWDSYVRIHHPAHSMSSPGTDSGPESENFSFDYNNPHYEATASPPTAVVKTTAVVSPIAIRPNTVASRGSISPTSRKPPTRKMSTKTTKAITRRPSQAVRPETEKKVGKRKGPLKPDQRKQAGEIRKLGACLRCRFLKKTVSCTSCTGFGKPQRIRINTVVV